jgi:hypothetical protein
MDPTTTCLSNSCSDHGHVSFLTRTKVHMILPSIAREIAVRPFASNPPMEGLGNDEKNEREVPT